MDSEIMDFIESLEVMEIPEVIFNRSLYTRPRLYRERPDYFTKYDDLDFFRRYRLSKDSVLFLLEKIEQHLEFKDNRQVLLRKLLFLP